MGILNNSGSTLITAYTVGTGTWVPDDRTTEVTLIGWGAGGGGGSGRQGATTAAGGGNGGATGGCFMITAPIGFFNPIGETYVVGAGGTGGVAQTTANTNGNNGTNGTMTSLGNITTKLKGTNNYGLGGIATSASANSGGYIYDKIYTAASPAYFEASAGSGSNIAGSNPTATGGIEFAFLMASSAGGGGGADSGTERAGGAGGVINKVDLSALIAGGTAGLESTTIHGGAGNAQTATGGIITGGTGGGGGGGQSAGAIAGDGGLGGFPGGGGGGGGGSLNGTNSGIGGNGANGYLIVIEYLT